MQDTDILQPNGQVAENDLPVQRHTEDMQEIITKVPSWILRWGITLFFGILLMAEGIALLVRYPDTIKGNLQLVATESAKPVVAVASGQVTKVLVSKGTIVKTGQVLAIAETIGSVSETYQLIAPQDGKIGFAAIVQPGAFLKAGQQVFAVHPLSEQFFGIMGVPQGSITKIKEGQTVLIKIRNYPPDDYGQLKGKISYIADEPLASGLFMVKVDLDKTTLNEAILLKDWMVADADIITENVSLQSRVLKSIFKGLR